MRGAGCVTLEYAEIKFLSLIFGEEQNKREGISTLWA